MVQNIHPLGIKTRFLPLLVLRFTVRPCGPLTSELNGKDISKPPFLFFSPSLKVVFRVDIATKKLLVFAPNYQLKRWSRRKRFSTVLALV